MRRLAGTDIGCPVSGEIQPEAADPGLKPDTIDLGDALPEAEKEEFATLA